MFWFDAIFKGVFRAASVVLKNLSKRRMNSICDELCNQSFLLFPHVACVINIWLQGVTSDVYGGRFKPQYITGTVWQTDKLCWVIKINCWFICRIWCYSKRQHRLPFTKHILNYAVHHKTHAHGLNFVVFWCGLVPVDFTYILQGYFVSTAKSCIEELPDEYGQTNYIDHYQLMI